MADRNLSRAEEVFHAALARSPEEREGLVEEACQGDEELRVEVRDLLAHYADAKRLLETTVAGAETRPLALLPGARLGPYETVAPLGEGGMGEVYRAKDTRLDRTVALKVLPTELTRDREALQRFEREARAIARLAHPHICMLLDVGREAGIDFLVLEHLEGHTLVEELQKGPLRLERALKYGVQIAEALETAHRHGVVHRDLKPANIAVTRSGTKLLDFGLAKLVLPRPAAFEPAASATAADPAPGRRSADTRPGLLLGTLQYMAPEQVQGKEVDARTDIFALGAVVYEMVTGRRPFEGASQATLVAAILEASPAALSERAPMSPPHLDRVVRRCLAKDPDDRWQSAADTAAAPRERISGRRVLPWGLAGAAAVSLGVALAGPWRPAPDEPRPVARASISLPEGHRLAVASYRSALTLSPSGSHLAFLAAPEGGRRRIFVRALDGLEATPLPGTEDAQDPFFSADGRFIGFFVHDKELKKIPVTGGPAVTVCSAPGADGASWGPDDTIIFPARSEGLRRVHASGGTVEVLTTPDQARGERFHAYPHFLPDGRAVLYALQRIDDTSADDRRIALRSLETGEQKTLIEGGTNPRYLPGGYILYSRAGALWAVRFDLESLTVSGSPVRVLDGVRTYLGGGDPTFTVAGNGTLVYLPGGAESGSSLVWVDRQGASSPITPERRGYFHVAISPDGRRIALTIGWSNHQVWTYDLSRSTLSRLTHEYDQHVIAWTPDGKRVLFSSNASQPENLFWKALDGGGPPERLLAADRIQIPGSVSSDGQLAYQQRNPSTGWDILLHAMEAGTAPRELLVTEFNEVDPRFSPDGRWLAYASDRTGRYEIYVTAFPGPGEHLLVSREGGLGPRWAQSGRELFYRSGDRMMVADIETAPALAAGQPRALFAGPYRPSYDVSPDGERFAMIAPEVEHVTRLNVVFNWFGELEAKMRDAE